MQGRSARLRKLVALAAAEERRECIEVGRSQRELDAMVRRLQELTGYRRDYAGRQTPGDTVSALRWHDYQSFLARLDRAVEAQRQLITDGERDVEAHRRRWLARRQRRDSLQRVLDRYQRDERVAAERRAQKQLDDRQQPDDLWDAD